MSFNFIFYSEYKENIYNIFEHDYAKFYKIMLSANWDYEKEIRYSKWVLCQNITYGCKDRRS